MLVFINLLHVIHSPGNLNFTDFLTIFGFFLKLIYFRFIALSVSVNL